MHAAGFSRGGMSGFWLSQINCLTGVPVILTGGLHSLSSLPCSSSRAYQAPTSWLSSCNRALWKLSNSHGGFRGWAKEALGVLLVEVSSLFLTTAPANIQCRAQGEM